MINLNSMIKNTISFLLIFSSFFSSQLSASPLLEVQKFDKIKYVSAADYSKHANMRTVFIKEKQKLILQFKSKKITISPNSSFLIIDDKTYNLSLPVIFDGSTFWIPLNSFLRIVAVSNLPDLKLDSSEKFLIVGAPSNNILNCNIQNKKNGTLIQINTNKYFNDNQLSASITRGGWLNLNIVGGELDSLLISDNTNIISPVLRVRPLQMKNSAQISFLIKDDIDDYSILSDDKSINISIRSNIEVGAQKIKEMKNRWNLDTIVIDPGHGGKDPGCLRKGLMEKTITLDVAKKLGKMIEQKLGIKVIYTRTEDEFIPLWKRTKIANDSGGKLFISIHVNAASNASSARGFETYFIRPGKFDDATEVAQRENKVIELEEPSKKYKKLNKENLIIATMAQASFTKQSEFFADQIQKEFDKNFVSPNRGVKQAGFHVLVGASMPNVLVELGFLSNSKDYRMLSQSKQRKKMAESIFDAIVTYKDEYEKNF